MQFYVGEILAGRPFTLVRYGEGEWRSLHPDMQKKKNHIYSEWRDAEAQKRLRNTLLNYHKHPRYWPAIWHQRAYATGPRMGQIKHWLTINRLQEIPWHDGRLWRRTLENDAAYPMIEALQKQPLPIVFVGPHRARCAREHFKGTRFIETHYTHAYHDIDELEKAILAVDGPALFSFSVGGTAKIIMHDLFPMIGEQSFLIDFGAFWEGLCGGKVRPYQRELDKHRLRKNWSGK